MPKEKNAPENYEAFIKKVREKLIFKTIKRGGYCANSSEI